MSYSLIRTGNSQEWMTSEHLDLWKPEEYVLAMPKSSGMRRSKLQAYTIL